MGWLFGNKDNSRTETKTVNDNGKLKELQLTITGPDSTMVVTGDEYRTTVPLRGNQPVAAEEVSIERKAPNGMWLNSLIPFYDGDVKGTQKKARSLWQLPAVEGKSQGGWMNKFQNGGSTQPTQDQAMKELMAIVQQAATELQSNKPGQGVQTLAQIANDPQGSQLLDVLVQQVPEAGQIVEAVMKMVGAFKCGGKTKKKVKKGAKGCVPCKKLMRVGGKLINVWSDCEGNIISKHQVGGWIRKGYEGLKIGNTTIGGFSNDHLMTLDKIKALQDVQNNTARYYYDPTDGSVKKVKYENGAWGNPETYTLTDGQTFGTGDGQINLWEDGYNLETGLMPGTQAKRTYKSGAVEMLNSRAETVDPVVFKSKADEGQTNAGYSMDPNRNVTLNYTVAEKARNLRNQRRADYWANRMAGNSIAVSAKERRHQRRMDQNAVYGWHANQGADFFGQKEGFVPIGSQDNEGNSYKTFYNAHKNYTKNKSKVTTPNEGDVEISASTPSPTKTAAPANLIKAQQRHKQGGWLTKFN